MKTKALLLVLFCFAAAGVKAQDILYFKNWESIKVKVVSIDEKEVEYKRFDNLEGPTYSLRIKKICRIEFENGTVENYCKGEDYQPSEEELAGSGVDPKMRFALGVGASIPMGDLTTGSEFVGVKGKTGISWNMEWFYLLKPSLGLGLQLGGKYLNSDASPIVDELNPIPPAIANFVSISNVVFANGNWAVHHAHAGIWYLLPISNNHEFGIKLLGGYSAVSEPTTRATGSVEVNLLSLEFDFSAENFPEIYYQFSGGAGLNYTYKIKEGLRFMLYADYMYTAPKITHKINIYPEKTGNAQIDQFLEVFEPDLEERTYVMQFISLGAGLAFDF